MSAKTFVESSGSPSLGAASPVGNSPCVSLRDPDAKRVDTGRTTGSFALPAFFAETAAVEGPPLLPGRAVAEAELFLPLATWGFFAAGVPVSKEDSRDD